MDNLLSARQLAKAIGVSYESIYQWNRIGRLKGHKGKSGPIRFSLADGIAAKSRTKPSLKHGSTLPDTEPPIIGYCYSDPYGNIRVRYNDLLGKTHDSLVTTAAKADDIALPAEDYYAKPPAKHPQSYSFIDMSERLNTVEMDENSRVRHTVSDMSPITEDFSHPCQKINLDLTSPVTVEATATWATATWAKATPHNTTSVPNDIQPPPPVKFEFDDMA